MSDKDYTNLAYKIDSLKEFFEKVVELKEVASIERHKVINKQFSNVIDIQKSQSIIISKQDDKINKNKEDQEKKIDALKIKVNIIFTTASVVCLIIASFYAFFQLII